MGMTIDDTILCLKGIKQYGRDTFTEQSDWQNSLDTAIDTMHKYQKIEDIYYHQSGEALENSLRAVIEDGKID